MTFAKWWLWIYSIVKEDPSRNFSHRLKNHKWNDTQR